MRKLSGAALMAALVGVAGIPAVAGAFRPFQRRPEKIFTSADEERIAKAEAKRARKAAKRLKESKDA